MMRWELRSRSKSRVSRRARNALLSVMISIWGAGQAHAIEARVAASLEPDGEVWVGERVALLVDLKTDGLSFRDQRILLPEIPGALLLEDSITPVKLDEQIDGETWQVLRYAYPLFLQRSGPFEVPAIDVEFSAAAEFGTEPRPFRLSTTDLSLSARVPPGVKDIPRLVTTPRFSVRAEVDPEPGALRVGDTLTRKIVRNAVDVSGMAFAPLVTEDIPGLAVYERSPELSESRNRGEMLGTRIDTMTYVLQEPGRFVLPAVQFEWWNPQTLRLETSEVPALTFDVEPSALFASFPATWASTTAPLRRHPGVALSILVMLGGCVLVIWRGAVPLALKIRSAREARRIAEPARFRKLVRACRSNDPALAYNALMEWLDARAESKRMLCVGDGDGDGDGLSIESQLLQRALVHRDTSWRGKALALAARRARREVGRSRRAEKTRALRSLNPRGT